MSRFMIASFVIAGLAASGTGVSQTTPAAVAQTTPAKTVAAPALTKDQYADAKKKADAQYKIDREACSSLRGNAKDICVAEAKGRNDIARVEAAVAYENTPRTRESARVARARAAYDVSMEKCDDLAGNPKNVCVKEAKAAFVRGKADARIDRIAGNTRKDASAKDSEAVKEANAEKRDADLKVALQKCDAFAGSAKEACVGNAKLQYGNPSGKS